MACYHPLHGWQVAGQRVSFSGPGYGSVPITVPCGQCIGCRLERSRVWAARIMHEASMHESNCFVTLTYADEHLPKFNSLYYRDFQLFCKRLRKSIGSFRFFMCGEYGDLESRPHYHFCLFGHAFYHDRYYWRKSPAGFPLFRSATLERSWTSGSAEVGELSFDSAAYVARYVMKKITGEQAVAHYTDTDSDTGEVYSWREPEFCNMSRRPGIGATWIDEFRSDVYPHDHLIVDGKKFKSPRYYDKRVVSDSELTALKEIRKVRAWEHYDNCSPERLRVREVCAKAKLSNSTKRVL